MSGTSLDGLDCSLVEIQGEGLSLRARAIRSRSAGLGELGKPLRALAEQTPMTAGEIATLMKGFSDLHAATVLELLAGERADLVCVHGQTVYHKPPVSWQLFQAAPLARAVGCPVVHDLRQMDLATGGQGAPITPIADWVLFGQGGSPGRRVNILNLGGFCNFTSLGDSVDATLAGDVCACNQLLDAAARTMLRAPYDQDGAAAMRGNVSEDALEDLMGVMRAQGRAGRSLGTGDELADWIARHRYALSGDDMAATACAGIAETIGERMAKLPGEEHAFLLAGGGVRNAALARALGSALPGSVRNLDQAGVPAAYREAICFAVLGALCQDRTPITLPAVTGCSAPAPISGAWVLP